MRSALRLVHRSSCLIAILLFAGSARSATVTVCPGGCDHTTIQAAVNAAAPGDTIDVAAGIFVENVNIDRELTIEGAGVGRTIVDGGAAGSVFAVLGVPVTLRGLTIRNGLAFEGGGVSVLGAADVTLDACEIRENRATFWGGGVFNQFGKVTITTNTIAGNDGSTLGGGVFNYYGSLNVDNSLIQHNRASYGGGISSYFGGPTTVSNSTISWNLAFYGGGLGVYADLTLTDSTVTANRSPFAGGGLSGYFGYGTLTIERSIIAANEGSDCAPYFTAVSQGHNLDGDGSCGFSQPTDLSGVDPRLDTLQDNGGPTLTHAPRADSPAVDGGGGVCSATDQRGVARPIDGDLDGMALCDSGAHELDPDDPVATVDQQQPAVEEDAVRLGISQLAQIVTPGVTGELKEIRVPVECAGSGYLNTEIRPVIDGVPGRAIASARRTPAFAYREIFFANPPLFESIPVAPPVRVVAGVPYAIVLRADPGDCVIGFPPDGDPYDGGNRFTFGDGGWIEECGQTGARCDLPFVTLVAPGGDGAAAPLADAGSYPDFECAGPEGALVLLDGSSSTDANSTPGTNDDIVIFEWFEDFDLPTEVLLASGETAGVALSRGTHAITLRVTDASGLSDTDDVLVTVADTMPPQIQVSADPMVLWPPNHQLVNVSVTVVVADVCGGTEFTLIAAESSEPDDAPGAGDGATTGDIQQADLGTPDVHVRLRAERIGGGPGRTYTLRYTATDGAGNVSEPAEALVRVPRSRGRRSETPTVSERTRRVLPNGASDTGPQELEQGDSKTQRPPSPGG